MSNKNVINSPVLFFLILCLIAWAIYFVIKKNTLYLLKQNYALEIKLDGGVGIFVRISGELFLTKK